jgi:hypothetical protein
MCLGAFLGAICGALGVTVFGVSLLGGVGIYLGVTVAITGLSAIWLLRRPLRRPEEDYRFDTVSHAPLNG